MSTQFMRVYDLVIGAAGTGVRIFQTVEHPGLRVQFEIIKTLRSSLNTAVIKVYNLAPDNERKIKGEFDEVLLSVGYEGAALLVFRGQIRWATTYSEGTDRITEIHAADGERDARKSIVNFTLAAGTTDGQLLDKLVGSFESTTKGQIVIKDKKRLRGRVVSGLAYPQAVRIGQENGANASIQDGRLDIIPADSTLPTQAIVIRADTGMKAAPEVDDNGVKVRCQLNPRIRCNGRIQLDNHDLKLKVFKERERKPGAQPAARAGGTTSKSPKSKNLARLDPDGRYKCYKVVHKGDTRGSTWESTVFAVGLDKSVPAATAVA